MVLEVKSVRGFIDGVFNQLEAVIVPTELQQEIVLTGADKLPMGYKLPHSTEFQHAISSAKLGKMWLGMVLQFLGTDYPYPESTNPESSLIHAPSDSGHFLPLPKEVGDYVSYIKNARKYLEKLITDVETLQGYTAVQDGMGAKACQLSWQYLHECKMWLGMELGRIGDLRTASAPSTDN